MSILVGKMLPAAVRAAFDGDALEEKLGLAYLLVTADADGTPRPCLLSAGEILEAGEHALRLGLWPESRTTENLTRGSPALLCYLDDATVLYIRGRARRLAGTSPTPLALLELQVEAIESDDHPGMPLTSGIRFTVEGSAPGDVLVGWQAQLGALRAATAPGRPPPVAPAGG